jgi:hypothetical protein
MAHAAARLLPTLLAEVAPGECPSPPRRWLRCSACTDSLNTFVWGRVHGGRSTPLALLALITVCATVVGTLVREARIVGRKVCWAGWLVCVCVCAYVACMCRSACACV